MNTLPPKKQKQKTKQNKKKTKQRFCQYHSCTKHDVISLECIKD